MSCLFFVSPSSISDGTPSTLECPPDSAVCMHIAKSTLLHSVDGLIRRPVHPSLLIVVWMRSVHWLAPFWAIYTTQAQTPMAASTHHPISARKIHPHELRLSWDHSVHSWPIQPSPIAYWYHMRKLCKWNGLNPPKTIRLSHHSDVRRLRNPPFRGLRERAIYRA